jgi:predicted component of type VI protein secretion system
VEATTPLRGGDPAAMLGSAAPARPGLTEILRAAPPLADESQEVTKIRMAPKPAARDERPGAAPAPAPAPTPAPAPAAVAPPPAPPQAAPPAAAAAAPDAVLAQLAAGLGLPPEALAGHNPAQAAAQVATLARAAVVALRMLLEQQAQARRQIGSRAPALGAVRELGTLRLAATPEAALQALLAPGADAAAPVQRAAEELAAHQARLLAAFRGAAGRLGEDIAPASLQAALGATAAAPTGPQQAQLWALYTQVWQSLGLAPGQGWAQGFQEAALLHLAAAYDDSPR